MNGKRKTDAEIIGSSTCTSCQRGIAVAVLRTTDRRGNSMRKPICQTCLNKRQKAAAA